MVNGAVTPTGTPAAPLLLSGGLVGGRRQDIAVRGGFVELRGVEALRRLQADFAGVLDLELIAFAQEGVFHDSVTRDLLREALKAGLKTLGGCPYMDRDQRAHIDWFFETAQAFGVPLDFHADSGDDPAQLTTSYIADQTLARGMQGRVTLGHLCLLDVLEPEHRARVIDRIREAGIHVIRLPATERHVKARPAARRTGWGVPRIGELREAGVKAGRVVARNTRTHELSIDRRG